jgi:hypothetical protein
MLLGLSEPTLAQTVFQSIGSRVRVSHSLPRSNCIDADFQIGEIRLFIVVTRCDFTSDKPAS